VTSIGLAGTGVVAHKSGESPSGVPDSLAGRRAELVSASPAPNAPWALYTVFWHTGSSEGRFDRADVGQ